MLLYHAVTSHTLELLNHLSSKLASTDLRLVGGTALALQYGHRSSIDLDFFGTLDDRVVNLHKVLDSIGSYEVIKETENIRIYNLEGVKVDFVDYSMYPWIDAPIMEDGLRLASPRDIAAMKINAIEGRGSRKDFIDIYFLLQHFSLNEIMGFYQQKYPNYSIFRALKSLSFFTDAEAQLMPVMYSPVSWEEVKQQVILAVRDYK